MMKYIDLTIIALLVIFTSCEKAFFKLDAESTDPHENFNYLWNECNEKYAYFELKNVDWDDVKIKYESKLYKGMSEDSMFNVLGSMLSELRDDHTTLRSNFNIASFGVSYLGQDNFDWRIVKDHYLMRDVYYSGPFRHNFIHNENIGYIWIPSFDGKVDNTNLDFILNKYKDTKGLILDLRENSGGLITDMFRILSRFVEDKTLLYYSRIKSGKEHDDFSSPEAVYVSPHDGIRYKNKVIVLTDRGTFSGGSFTCLATKALPNMILLGDTTGGGLGLPHVGLLPNGWRYRFSISQALTIDQSPEYENGVPPDIHVLFDWNELTKDEVIERAIEEILK